MYFESTHSLVSRYYSLCIRRNILYRCMRIIAIASLSVVFVFNETGTQELFSFPIVIQMHDIGPPTDPLTNRFFSFSEIDEYYISHYTNHLLCLSQ